MKNEICSFMLASKSKTFLSIVFAIMLGRYSKTNCLQIGNSTFGSLFITILLNQEDWTIEMFLYPLQTCSTKSLMNLIWARSFFGVICANTKEISGRWWWYTLPLFEFLMFCKPSILDLHLYLELFDEVIAYTFFDVVVACTLLFHQHELNWKKHKRSCSYEIAPTTLHCLQVTNVTLSMLPALL